LTVFVVDASVAAACASTAKPSGGSNSIGRGRRVSTRRSRDQRVDHWCDRCAAEVTADGRGARAPQGRFEAAKLERWRAAAAPAAHIRT
jgi:hypothetical protein